jgi:hypothetical protein
MGHALHTYLNDHLAGATFAINLLEHMRDEHGGDDIGRFAARMISQIQEDSDVLKHLIEQVGGSGGPMKRALGWLTEKASRGKIRARHDGLGVFESLEVLALGVQGKLSLWHALGAVVDAHPALRELDLNHLVARANAQHREIESLRLAVAATVLRPRTSRVMAAAREAD